MPVSYTHLFSMVNQIYSYYRDDEKQGRYWYENAFNLITENIYGVLDEEGVQGYLTSGLSRQDINAANIMSPVSYTHLDVYKRQIFQGGGGGKSGNRPEPLGESG